MWTEHAPQELVESKVFPRALGLAEVLWSGAEKTRGEGAYEAFQKRLDTHLKRLDFKGVDYGLEAVPVSLSLAQKETGELVATVVPEADYIKGFAAFEGNEVEIGRGFIVDGPGDVVAKINYRGRELERHETFRVDAHAAVYKEINLSYEPSPYYTGGGNHALVDGRVGSGDFRDGTWQAKQGEDLLIEIDLEEIVEIDSISFNVYLYQDAWIFEPSEIVFLIDDKEVARIGNCNSLDKNNFQGVVNISSGRLADLAGRRVAVQIDNPGVCPDWHAAATEPSWLFLDELVVRRK